MTPSYPNDAFTPPSHTFANIGSNKQADFALVPRSISGKVTLNGAGLSGVAVTLSFTKDAATTTDAGGNYTFTNSASAVSTDVTPSHLSYTFAPAEEFLFLDRDMTANFEALAGPPGPASAPSPANGALGVSLSPTLSWTAGAGATSHDVYFGVTSPPPLVTNTAGATHIPGTLLPNKKYFWKVVAKIGGGTAGSGIWSFTTQAGLVPPAKPLLTAPANNAAAAPLPVILKWKAVAGATSYDVYLGTAATPPLIASVTGINYTPNTNLITTGTIYYWFVVAKNGSGAAASLTWKFKTKAAPNPPKNPNPVNLATGVSRTPTLQWSAAAGATSYDVYIGTVPGLSGPPTFNTTGTTYTPSTALLAGKKYYWKVVARSATGKASSAVWSFTTK